MPLHSNRLVITSGPSQTPVLLHEVGSVSSKTQLHGKCGEEADGTSSTSMRMFLSMYEQSRLDMDHSRHGERRERPSQDLLTSSISLYEYGDEEGEWHVLIEVGLGAAGYEQRVVFAGGRGGLSEGLVGLDALLDNATLEEDVVEGEREGEC